MPWWIAADRLGIDARARKDLGAFGFGGGDRKVRLRCDLDQPRIQHPIGALRPLGKRQSRESVLGDDARAPRESQSERRPAIDIVHNVVVAQGQRTLESERPLGEPRNTRRERVVHGTPIGYCRGPTRDQREAQLSGSTSASAWARPMTDRLTPPIWSPASTSATIATSTGPDSCIPICYVRLGERPLDVFTPAFTLDR